MGKSMVRLLQNKYLTSNQATVRSVKWNAAGTLLAAGDDSNVLNIFDYASKNIIYQSKDTGSGKPLWSFM